jgi:hypothetical protein
MHSVCRAHAAFQRRHAGDVAPHVSVIRTMNGGSKSAVEWQARAFHDDDHGDMGGLHRDLASTGTAMGRAEFLRYGLSAGALALFGCGGSLADITSSTPGTDTGSATGVPLVIQLTLVSASTCTPLANRAVYLWHCDAPGRYSLYTSGVTNRVSRRPRRYRATS